MKTSRFLITGAAVAVLMATSWMVTAGVEASDPPNVILIMTDDQGYGDFGFNGNPVIRTPNLDAMARRSARMENFYVSPVCSPTRACLMTGRYNYRTRCIDTYIGRSMMDPGEVTVAEVLRRAGYGTGIFGKWHLGDNHPMRAMDQGFEESLVLRGGGIGQPSDPIGAEGRYTNPTLIHNGVPVGIEGYCTDAYYRYAMEYMDQCLEDDRPFFIYIADNCPHGPFHDVPPEEYAYYREVDLKNDRFPQDQGHSLPPGGDTDKRARIYAMITNIDKNIGKLFAHLRRRKIYENTLVLFLVDNGPNGRRYVAGMRGMKSNVHEGGIRSPLLAHWPARIEAGSTSDRIAAHIDLMPTIIEACGVAAPVGVRLDGRSLLPLWDDQPAEWPDRTLVIQSHRGDVPVRYHNFAARTQNWKLVHSSGFGNEDFSGPPRFELYAMDKDPLEMRDVAAEHPDVVAAMVREYDAWFDDVSHTRPDNYAPPRIDLGVPEENPVVLTRQNWRHLQGRPWHRDSRGKWLVHVAATGVYQLECRFSPESEAGTITVRIGGQSYTREVEPGIDVVNLLVSVSATGDTEILADVAYPEVRRGVYQLSVFRSSAPSSSPPAE